MTARYFIFQPYNRYHHEANILWGALVRGREAGYLMDHPPDAFTDAEIALRSLSKGSGEKLVRAVIEGNAGLTWID